MAIDTYDKQVAALQKGQALLIAKGTLSNQAAGGMTSLWRATGIPAQAAIPGAAAVCDRNLLGAMPFTNPPAGQETNIGGLSVAGAASHLLQIYDRLSHMGGLSGIVTTAQPVNLTIPPNRFAAADGSDVEWFIEIFTDIGTTAVTATIAYTDQNNAAQTTTISLGGTSPANRANRLFQIFPNAGQTIKTITSITHVSTLTAGNYGFVCGKRILTEPMGQPNIGIGLDYAQCKMGKVPNDACLWMVLQASVSPSGEIRGTLHLMQG
jgi:hypothetical protein